jgi:hypothetical protein
MTPLSLTMRLGRKAVDLGNESELMASMGRGRANPSLNPSGCRYKSLGQKS